MPSDAELERDVREALRVANMDEMSLKVIRKQLEVKWQVNSKYQQKRIKCSSSRGQSVPQSQLCTRTAAAVPMLCSTTRTAARSESTGHLLRKLALRKPC